MSPMFQTMKRCASRSAVPTYSRRPRRCASATFRRNASSTCCAISACSGPVSASASPATSCGRIESLRKMLRVSVVV